MVCEMFPVGAEISGCLDWDRICRPRRRTAIPDGDDLGVITMVLIVVMTDHLLWRPLIAWSDKFKFENVESGDRVTSPVLDALRNSQVLGIINRYTFRPMAERFYMDLAAWRRRRNRVRRWRSRASARPALYVRLWRFAGGGGVAAFHALLLLKRFAGRSFCICLPGGTHALRVNAALLLGSLWAIPVGVAIGFNPRFSS